MASLIPGFEYDIFISYRQKDNRHDGWVTEFVENLKGELESTFKDEISVYFDTNPHDGLLETHDVESSLKDKLKCLIFIPIISRTYCDPKSFAWEHEFKAFAEHAAKDKFGLKIKLPSGNVANRILPVSIHDLDNDDNKLCESVLGGVLRGVEFIYKEPGVNRSLSPKDHEEKNLNKTNYRNQINKVALAINEIIVGMRVGPATVVKGKILHEEPKEGSKYKGKLEVSEKPAGTGKLKLISGVAIFLLLIIAAIIAYPKIFNRDILEKFRASGERIPVVVMPFQNMTNDTILNFWQIGIQIDLINALSDFPEELAVRPIGPITELLQSKGLTNYASLTTSITSSISKKLDADVFISGSIIKTGSTIRVYAQVIDSKTKNILKPFQIDVVDDKDNIFILCDALSAQVKDFLILSHLKQNEPPHYRKFVTTTSPEAYRFYISGLHFSLNEEHNIARERFSEALKIDTNFINASIMLSVADLNLYLYNSEFLKIDTNFINATIWDLNLYLYKEGFKNIQRAYKKRDQVPLYIKLKINDIYAWYTEGAPGRIKHLKQMLELNDQDPSTHSSLGNSYQITHQFDKAIPELEKAREIYKKWGLTVPLYYYDVLGHTYHQAQQYKKEEKLYKEAERYFPNVETLIRKQSVLALTTGKMKAADEYLKKFISILRGQSLSETVITANLAGIYSESGITDKAEDYFRQVLSLEPQNPEFLRDFADFLIDKDLNINEGMELIDKALKMRPIGPTIHKIKGWGLYKQGKYKEALKHLEISDSLWGPIYEHEVFLHLEAVKKSIDSQK